MAEQKKEFPLLPTEMKNCEELVRKALSIMVAEIMEVADRTPQDALPHKPYPKLVSAVEQARLLLETSDLSVKSVAYSVGFEDPLYFSRRFRELAGCPPKTYAQRGKEGSSA